MKILELNLLAFGPFTDTRLDLSEGREGFHLVYGPNEAGKSSALRALRQMLFGIPERSGDDFVHPYGKMRVGGVLQHSDGSLLEFIRRKGRTGTLRSKNNKDALEDSVLNKFLGNMDAAVFEIMFGIGHGDLVRGGEEIMQGGGNVGQALFAAGSGISDLRKVQMELQAEADALFRPAAPTRPINEAIAQLRKNQKDQDSLPAYATLDELIKAYVEEHRSLRNITRKTKKLALIEKIVRMVDKSEYKRRQSPPGIKITPRAFGKDWRLPITNKYSEF